MPPGRRRSGRGARRWARLGPQQGRRDSLGEGGPQPSGPLPRLLGAGRPPVVGEVVQQLLGGFGGEEGHPALLEHRHRLAEPRRVGGGGAGGVDGPGPYQRTLGRAAELGQSLDDGLRLAEAHDVVEERALERRACPVGQRPPPPTAASRNPPPRRRARPPARRGPGRCRNGTGPGAPAPASATRARSSAAPERSPWSRRALATRARAQRSMAPWPSARVARTRGSRPSRMAAGRPAARWSRASASPIQLAVVASGRRAQRPAGGLGRVLQPAQLAQGHHLGEQQQRQTGSIELGRQRLVEPPALRRPGPGRRRPVRQRPAPAPGPAAARAAARRSARRAAGRSGRWPPARARPWPAAARGRRPGSGGRRAR